MAEMVGLPGLPPIPRPPRTQNQPFLPTCGEIPSEGGDKIGIIWASWAPNLASREGKQCRCAPPPGLSAPVLLQREGEPGQDPQGAGYLGCLRNLSPRLGPSKQSCPHFPPKGGKVTLESPGKVVLMGFPEIRLC